MSFDGLFCLFCLFVLVTIASMISLATSAVVLYPLLAVMLLAHFAAGARSGGTPGERAVPLRVVDARSGRRATAIQALARSIVTIILVASGSAIFIQGFNNVPAEGHSAADILILYLMAVLFAMSVIAHIWMLFSLDRRTLTDRLTGIAVVRWPGVEHDTGRTTNPSLAHD